MAVEANPVIVGKQVEMAKVQEKMREAELDQNAKMAKVAVDKQNADTEFLKVMAQIQGENLDREIQAERLDAENARTAVEIAKTVAEATKDDLINPGGE